MICLLRAYQHPAGHMPASADVDLLAEGVPERGGLIVLGSGWARPAALDVEARWAEAGLGWTSISEPRNFAHGRHHGAMRMGSEATVLTLETAEDFELFDDLIRLLPKSMRVLRLQVQEAGPWGAVALVVQTVRLAGLVAARQGLDPGRPKVPGFGRSLYHRGIPVTMRESPPSLAELAVLRKVGERAWHSADEALKERLLQEPAAWCRLAAKVPFGGIVFDYDGTLCHTGRRFDPLPASIVDLLTKLLAAGVYIGVATGRGDSAHAALRLALPEEHWGMVLLGLHNGAETLWLAEPAPTHLDERGGALEAAVAELSASPYASLFTVHVSVDQISIRSVLSGEELRPLVCSAGPHVRGLSLRCSGHSVDLVPGGTSKTAVVDGLRRAMASLKPAPYDVLTVGDRGDEVGNDFELLDRPWSLSCDRVSAALDRCWNLSPPGLRGPDAVVHYFQDLLEVRRHSVVLRPPAAFGRGR